MTTQAEFDRNSRIVLVAEMRRQAFPLAMQPEHDLMTAAAVQIERLMDERDFLLKTLEQIASFSPTDGYRDETIACAKIAIAKATA